jgi:hypothetical protein
VSLAPSAQIVEAPDEVGGHAWCGERDGERGDDAAVRPEVGVVLSREIQRPPQRSGAAEAHDLGVLAGLARHGAKDRPAR